jgi:hypothetical protein
VRLRVFVADFRAADFQSSPEFRSSLRVDAGKPCLCRREVWKQPVSAKSTSSLEYEKTEITMQTLSSRTTRFHSHATHGSRLGGPRLAAGSRLGDLLAGLAFIAAIAFAAAIIFGFVG